MSPVRAARRRPPSAGLLLLAALVVLALAPPGHLPGHDGRDGTFSLHAFHERLVDDLLGDGVGDGGSGDGTGDGGTGDGTASDGAPAPGLGDLLGDLLFEPVLDVGGFGVTGLHLLAGAGMLGLLGLAAALGVKHVTPDNALDHEGRAGLYRTIRTRPGIHLRELARAQDMAVTSATWHLKKLQDVGLVRAAKLEGYKVFYPAEGGREAKRLTVATKVLSNDNAERVLRLVVARPGLHQRGLADALDLNHATVRWHLDKLKTAGLVTEVPLSHSTVYFVSAEGLHALELVGGPGGGSAAVPTGTAS